MRKTKLTAQAMMTEFFEKEPAAAASKTATAKLALLNRG